MLRSKADKSWMVGKQEGRPARTAIQMRQQFFMPETFWGCALGLIHKQPRQTRVTWAALLQKGCAKSCMIPAHRRSGAPNPSVHVILQV